MGNCCFGSDFPAPRGGSGDYTPSSAKGPGHTTGGGPPSSNVMTPDEAERREQVRKAAEERARQNAVRGTQRTVPKRKPKEYHNRDGNTGGPDISDWT